MGEGGSFDMADLFGGKYKFGKLGEFGGGWFRCNVIAAVDGCLLQGGVEGMPDGIAQVVHVLGEFARHSF